MWTKSENGEVTKPAPLEVSGDIIIVRRSFRQVDATEEFPAHWEWEEWQMTKEQYEVYQYHEVAIKEQEDALIELAELYAEQDDAIVELAEILGGD